MEYNQNEFELSIQKFYTPEELDILQHAVIGILGAGGIGSNCAISLARSGIRHFIIDDMDTVELSNLNRQSYFPQQVGAYKVDALTEILTHINPNITVEKYTDFLTKDTMLQHFSNAHILVEAFDKVESKVDFFSAISDVTVPCIMISGIAGIGKSDELGVTKMGDNLYIVGDKHSSITDECPYAPRVAIAANKQADIVLALLLGKDVL